MRGPERRARAAAAVALCAAALWWAGCSPEERYPVVAFFFDGVPAPGDAGAPEAAGRLADEAARRAAMPRPQIFSHTPYRLGQCNECHPETRSLWLGEEKRKGLCFTCHEHEKLVLQIQAYAFVHGPVAADACDVCHDPHESLYKGVLVAPDPQLCRECHDILTGSAAPWHHSAVKDECLGCHDPHGGANRFFVKEGAVEKGAGAGLKE